MKLRQKVKNTKRELKAFNELPLPHYSFEKICHIQKGFALEKIARLKHAKTSLCDDAQPFKNITHLKLYADFNVIGELKSPNGKPFTTAEIKAFWNDWAQNNLANYAKRTASIDPTSQKTPSVRYTAHYSSDRTKNKSYSCAWLFEQPYGSTEFYEIN